MQFRRSWLIVTLALAVQTQPVLAVSPVPLSGSLWTRVHGDGRDLVIRALATASLKAKVSCSQPSHVNEVFTVICRNPDQRILIVASDGGHPAYLFLEMYLDPDAPDLVKMIMAEVLSTIKRSPDVEVLGY